MSSVVNGIKSLAVGTTSPLFEPVQVGSLELKTRIVYAPLTRCRAIDSIPQPAAKKYYSERARDGMLVLTEATCVSDRGYGYPHTPGIHLDKHVEAWKPIVKAVKEKNAYFFLQLWHVGRSSHPEYQPNGDLPIGPSAIPIRVGKVFAPKTGKPVDFPAPRALEKSEIPGVVQQYAQGARNALKAGFDGVEIHGANGYILDQFLKQSSNKRTDEYGGSIENRCRLMLEVVDAVVKEVGDSGRVGLRLSPYAKEFNDATEPDVDSMIELTSYLLKELNKYNLAYAHIVTSRAEGSNDAKERESKATLEPFRKVFTSKIIAAGGFTKSTGEEELDSGLADLICYGRWYLSNPDMPERFKEDKPLNKYNRDTFYTQDPVEGYTDYPFLKDIPEGTPTVKHYTGVTVFDPPKQKTRNTNEP